MEKRKFKKKARVGFDDPVVDYLLKISKPAEGDAAKEVAVKKIFAEAAQGVLIACALQKFSGPHPAKTRNERKVKTMTLQEAQQQAISLGGKKPCAWMLDEDGDYGTECGDTFVFTVDGPKENNFKFCPFCGGALCETRAALRVQEAIASVTTET